MYVASPLGFSEVGRSFHDRILVPRIVELGHIVFDPWKLTDSSKIEAALKLPYGIEKRNAWKQLNKEIGANNRAAIERCDVLFAILDGVDVDSGTASEVGYAFAKGKIILGYRGDFRLSADNEGSLVNLQVEYFIRESGGTIITSFDELAEGLASIESR